MRLKYVVFYKYTAPAEEMLEVELEIDHNTSLIPPNQILIDSEPTGSWPIEIKLKFGWSVVVLVLDYTS